MPGRLDAHYIAEDGSKRTPGMLHLAILGSLERFIGVLIELSAVVLTVLLEPGQDLVLYITYLHGEYAAKV